MGSPLRPTGGAGLASGAALRRPTGSPDWTAGRRALVHGAGVVEACRIGRFPAGLTARLAARWAGAWVDLVDELAGARVLVIEHAPGHAPMRLAEQAGEVAVVENHGERADFRMALWGDQAGAVRLGAGATLLSDRQGWDVIVLDGVRLGSTGLRGVAGGLAPGGRVVLVADNAASPVRALDRLGGRPAGPATTVGSGVNGAMGRAGLAVRQRFALLRSSAAPVTAFDLDAPAAAAAVLQAAATMIDGGRRRGLRLLEPAPGRRWASPALQGLLAPARLVVATPAGSPWAPRGDRPTGRIGYQRSNESKVVRGNPPTEIEKRYVSAADAEAEAGALEALAGAGLAVAPRLVRRPAPDRVRMSWLSGRPLEVAGLADDELQTWVRRAARLLARIQSAVGPDIEGRVLVHGDYWLGNLLHDGERIVAVVDWTSAHWADRRSDLLHLVDSLVDVRAVSPALLRRLTAAAGEDYDREWGALAGQGAPARS